MEHSVHWSQFCVEHSQSVYWFLPVCGTLSTLVTVVCGTLTVTVLVPTCLWNTQYTGSEFCVEHSQSVYWFLPICGTLSTLVTGLCGTLTVSVLVPTYLWNTDSVCNVVVFLFLFFCKEVKEENVMILLTVRSAQLEFFG